MKNFNSSQFVYQRVLNKIPQYIDKLDHFIIKSNASQLSIKYDKNLRQLHLTSYVLTNY